VARVREQHDERGERQHEHGEVELGEMEHEPVDRRPWAVAAVRGDAVVAEDRGRRSAPCDLDRDHDERGGADDAVQRRERGETTRATALDPREDERRGQHRGDDRHRLRPRFEGQRTDSEEQHLSRARRPF